MPSAMIIEPNVSAFIPIEAENGRFVVRRLKYHQAAPRILMGQLAFSQAEDLALLRNRKAGIPDHVWWQVGEWLKNADV
jgi:hypothetical protein